MVGMGIRDISYNKIAGLGLSHSRVPAKVRDNLACVRPVFTSHIQTEAAQGRCSLIAMNESGVRRLVLEDRRGDQFPCSEDPLGIAEAMEGKGNQKITFTRGVKAELIEQVLFNLVADVHPESVDDKVDDKRVQAIRNQAIKSAGIKCPQNIAEAKQSFVGMWDVLTGYIHGEVAASGKCSIASGMAKSGKYQLYLIDGKDGRTDNLEDPLALASRMREKGISRINFRKPADASLIEAVMLSMFAGDGQIIAFEAIETEPSAVVYRIGEEIYVDRIDRKVKQCMVPFSPYVSYELATESLNEKIELDDFDSSLQSCGSASDALAVFKASVLPFYGGEVLDSFINKLMICAHRFIKTGDIDSALEIWGYSYGVISPENKFYVFASMSRRANEFTDPKLKKCARRTEIAIRIWKKICSLDNGQEKKVIPHMMAAAGRLASERLSKNERDAESAAKIWKGVHDIKGNEHERLVPHMMAAAGKLAFLAKGDRDIDSAVAIWEGVYGLSNSAEKKEIVFKHLIAAADKLASVEQKDADSAVKLWKLAYRIGKENKLDPFSLMMAAAGRYMNLPQGERDAKSAILIWRAAKEIKEDSSQSISRHMMAAANRIANNELSEEERDVKSAIELWEAIVDFDDSETNVVIKHMLRAADKLINSPDKDKRKIQSAVWILGSVYYAVGKSKKDKMLVLINLSYVLNRLNEITEEIFCAFEEAKINWKDNSFYLLVISLVYYRMGRFREALSALEAIETIKNPMGTVILQKQAECLRKLQSYDAAIALSSSLIPKLISLGGAGEFVGELVDAYICRGYCYQEKGRDDGQLLDRSLSDFQEALNTAKILEYQVPPRLWTGLCYVFLQQGKRSEALQAIEKALRIDPENRKAYAALAQHFPEIDPTSL